MGIQLVCQTNYPKDFIFKLIYTFISTYMVYFIYKVLVAIKGQVPTGEFFSTRIKYGEQSNGGDEERTLLP